MAPFRWTQPIPSGWRTAPIRSLGSFIGGGTPSKAIEGFWSGPIPWASPKDFRTDVISDTEDHISEVALRSSATTLAPKGSVLMVVRSGILRHTLPVAEAGVSLALNQDLKALIPGSGINGRYVMWLLRGLQDHLLAGARRQGATVESMDFESFLSIEVPIPESDRQHEIAEYLDRETAEIDSLIERKRRLRALLVERGVSLVHRAVTKGLGRERLRNSGHEWIGDVPDTWKVVPLRKRARLESGHTPSRGVAEYWIDCTIPWVSLADVHQIRNLGRDTLYETHEKVSELGLAHSAARLLPAGTVMLSRTASVGFSAVMGVPMATTQDFANWICGPDLLPRYLLHVLRAMQPELRRLTMGSTHQTIYMPMIWSLMVPLPALDIQGRIVEHIDSELDRLGQLGTRITDQLGKLKERRAALITAAVTGQLASA